jgi:mannose-6-phosphate isomerase-like protein (cupin superfamily)
MTYFVSPGRTWCQSHDRCHWRPYRERLFFPAVERRLNSYYAEFPPVAVEKLRLHQHAGAEFLYVLAGTLGLRVGEEEHLLDARDSIYFDATVPHGYRRAGSRACCAIVVTTA